MISDSFFQRLEKSGIEYKLNQKMSEHTSFKIGGAADVFICPETEDELVLVLRLLKEDGLPFFILGCGSNLLVSDGGIEGAVISLKNISAVKVDRNLITCGAGVKLSAVCKVAQDNALSGLEFAYGIPGSVGGALFMNAGAYGGQMADVIESARCVDADGNIVVLTKSDMELGYRTSAFKTNGLIVVTATFCLNPGDKDRILANMSDFMARRKEKQPLEFPSAGSTFKRPEGYFAGALIEKNGLKGRSVGGAEVSVKHAGFVINRGGATAGDVCALIDEIKKTVLENDGVELVPEVIFVGRKEENLE